LLPTVGMPRLRAFLVEVHSKWSRDQALSHGAALAYYAIFSLAPLLVLVIAIAGLVLGRAAVQGEIVGRIEGLTGPDAARLIQRLVAQVNSPAAGIAASVAGLCTMLLGASAMVGQLQTALNQMWGTAASAGRGLRAAVRRRLAAFFLILGIGGLLLVSMLATAAVTAVGGELAAHHPLLAELIGPLNFVVSLSLMAAMFVLVFRILPDMALPWRDLWFGGVVTALLFTLGKTLIGWYLGQAGRTSMYGAAGSLVLLLLWIYYSAQILLLGAEVTEVYSRHFGSRRLARWPGA
jgi:membrane protein